MQHERSYLACGQISIGNTEQLELGSNRDGRVEFTIFPIAGFEFFDSLISELSTSGPTGLETRLFVNIDFEFSVSAIFGLGGHFDPCLTAGLADHRLWARGLTSVEAPFFLPKSTVPGNMGQVGPCTVGHAVFDDTGRIHAR